MSSLKSSNSLTPAHRPLRACLQAMARRGVRTYVEVGDALGELRDRHLGRGTDRWFDTSVRGRWGGGRVGNPLRKTIPSAADQSGSPASSVSSASDRDPRSEAIAKACDQTLRALRADDLAELDIRLTVRKRRPTAAPTSGKSMDSGSVAEVVGDELLPTLRWLLTQSAGTIADAAHQVETHGADLDDQARAQVAGDVRTLEEELATLKALLAGVADWDSDLERLLRGEIPALDEDTVEDA